MLIGTKVNGKQTVLKWYVLSVCVECLHGCWYEPVRGRNVIFYALMLVCRKKTSSKKKLHCPKICCKTYHKKKFDIFI